MARRRLRRSLHQTLSGLPDRYVSPELSEKRRQAARARWAKERGADTSNEGQAVQAPSDAPQEPPQFAAPIAATPAALEQAKPPQLTAMGCVMNALPEAVGVVLEIMRDDRQRGETRLNAAKVLLDVGGMYQEESKRLMRPVEEMNLAELEAFMKEGRAELARLRAEQPIDLAQGSDGAYSVPG
ncbi:MAG: hypothetical protein KIS79_09965 [Burkholderiales bacterium]|nr:hypothetical protein [Burkholderiales bacterium]